MENNKAIEKAIIMGALLFYIGVVRRGYVEYS